MPRPLLQYNELFRSCEIKREWIGRARLALARIIERQAHYRRVQERCGVPWIFTGILHYREAACSLDKQILNGQPWNQKTTLVPAGRGPWESLEASCIDALSELADGFAWSIPLMLSRMEAWNGWGYFQRGAQSGYLWNGSSHAPIGGYDRDGHWNPNYRSEQVGGAVILHEAVLQGIYEDESRAPVVMYDAKGERISKAVAEYQQFLNDTLRPSPGLKTDGWAGPKTSAAHCQWALSYLAGDPRG